MLAILLFTGGIFVALLSLIYLLSLSPRNTICPRCRKKKRAKEYAWNSLCLQCERRADE